jgi:hypothetical protein
VGQSYGAVVRGVALPVVTGLRHLPVCVGIYPVWCIHRVLPSMRVIVETPMSSPLKSGLTSPTRQRGLIETVRDSVLLGFDKDLLSSYPRPRRGLVMTCLVMLARDSSIGSALPLHQFD